MARYLFSAVENFKITSGAVTGPARAALKSIGDGLALKNDGENHGAAVEDTVFAFDPSYNGIAGEPGTPHSEWGGGTVNPRYYIVEVKETPANNPSLAATLGPDSTVTSPGTDEEEVIVKHKSLYGLSLSDMTSPELQTITDTRRMRLPLGRAMQLILERPEPS